MNKLGFGFLRFPTENGNINEESIKEMTDLFLEKGGRYFDTCYTYLNGLSEKAIRTCLTERHPRNSYLLCDKLPGYMCKAEENSRKFFDEEKQRCGVDYFDVYMLHWLNEKNYRIAEKLKQFDFLKSLKQSGEAIKTGFSYHDSAALLDEILTAHPEVDVVQLQINYLDWDSAGIESRKCYNTCVKHGKKVYVMEPVKGGTLCKLPAKAETKLKEIHPDWSNASWALRFVQSLEHVEICLSGMTDLSQIEENMTQIEPLTETERHLLSSVCDIINEDIAAPCTGCGYCKLCCPEELPIPEYFKLYNEIKRYPDEDWKIKPVYNHLTVTNPKASECIHCRACESHCPQRLKVTDLMERVSATFD